MFAHCMLQLIGIVNSIVISFFMKGVGMNLAQDFICNDNGEMLNSYMFGDVPHTFMGNRGLYSAILPLGVFQNCLPPLEE